MGYSKKILYVVSLILLLLLFTLSGCKTKYISVPEYHTEYVNRTDTFAKLDSVYIKDSVFVYKNRDTIFINKIAYRDRYHNIYKVKSDTIFKTDSIRVPYPVEKELTRNEQRLMSLGRLFVSFLFVIVGIAVILFFWYRNKKC